MRICSVEGCENKHEAKGYCKRHYKAFRKYGNPLAVNPYTKIKNSLPYEDCHKIIDKVEHKLCNTCEKWLPMNTDYFYKNKSNKSDGFHTWCKVCAVKKSEKRMYENYEEHKEAVNRYHQTEEGKKKDREGSKRQRENGYQKQYMQNNKDKLYIYGLKRRMNKSHEITDDEWNNCKMYFNNCCAYCGIGEKDAKEQQGHYLHKEHVKHDGANDITNCIPSCRSCNSQKWTFSLEDWFNDSNSNYTYERLNKIHQWLEKDCLEILTEKV